jgi:hypothetical protein
MNRAPRPGGRVHLEAEPVPAIEIGRGEKKTTRWGTALVVFMRVVAVLWMVQGLLQWRLPMLDQAGFEAMPVYGAAAVVFFAILDLIAAVGLWLAATWGGIIWLIAAFAQLATWYVLPGEIIVGGRLAMLANLALILVYFALNYRASIERDQ